MMRSSRALVSYASARAQLLRSRRRPPELPPIQYLLLPPLLEHRPDFGEHRLGLRALAAPPQREGVPPLQHGQVAGDERIAGKVPRRGDGLPQPPRGLGGAALP